MGIIAQGNRGGRTTAVAAFHYEDLPDPELPDWEAWGGGSIAPDARADSQAVQEQILAPGLREDLEQRLREESRHSFEAGRAQGIEQGRVAERAALGTEQQRVAAQLERLATAFAEERDRYLHAAEPEVVKLALAVAARILRREAQMDPLLLTGAVRVALGQLAATTSVRLRVPPAELDLWQESIALLPNLAVKPQVVAGDGMRLGDCVVETELGSVDLGVRAQLSEIERGFFDRAASASSSPEFAGAGRQS